MSDSFTFVLWTVSLEITMGNSLMSFSWLMVLTVVVAVVVVVVEGFFLLGGGELSLGSK